MVASVKPEDEASLRRLAVLYEGEEILRPLMPQALMGR